MTLNNLEDSWMKRSEARRLGTEIVSSDPARYGPPDYIRWANGHYAVRVYDQNVSAHLTFDSPLAWALHQRAIAEPLCAAAEPLETVLAALERGIWRTQLETVLDQLLAAATNICTTLEMMAEGGMEETD